MDLQLVAFSVLMVVFVLTLLIAQRKMYRQKAKPFESREDMSAEEFYSRFDGRSGLTMDEVTSVLLDVASEIGVPAGRLRPDDRFAQERRPVQGWEYDDGIGILEWLARRRAKALGVAVDLSRVATLDDYIRFMVAVEQRRPS